MDLQRPRPARISRTASSNAYLEITGDYDGLARAALLSRLSRDGARQGRLPARATAARPATQPTPLRAESRGYVRPGEAYSRNERQPAIVITHGLSGSGKTTLSQALLETIGAVRIRTDVERKRLHGLRPTDRERRPASTPTLYAAEVTRGDLSARRSRWRSTRRSAGLRRDRRRRIPEALAAPAVPGPGRRARRSRSSSLPAARRGDAARADRAAGMQAANDASDADLAVLEHQLRTQEPLAPDERTRRDRRRHRRRSSEQHTPPRCGKRCSIASPRAAAQRRGASLSVLHRVTP